MPAGSWAGLKGCATFNRLHRSLSWRRPSGLLRKSRLTWGPASAGPGKVRLMNRILVIGGTGNVGRHVVSQLAATGARFRAMTRNPDAAALPPHVEVVRGDLTVPETLDRCLQDIDTVFLVWVAPPAAAAGAVERIAAHARRIVYLTAPLKTPHPFFQQPNPSRAIAERVERAIEQSGLDWTFVRAGMFAGNARHFWGPQIRADGVIRWPYLSAPTAPIDERDIATIAVRALCDGAHAGAEYVV